MNYHINLTLALTEQLQMEIFEPGFGEELKQDWSNLPLERTLCFVFLSGIYWGESLSREPE